MKKISVLSVFLLFSGILFSTELKLTKNARNFEVTNCGEVYRINTALRGSWGSLLTFGKTDPDAVTLTLVTGAGAVHPQITPGDVKVEVDTPEKIVISATYKVAVAGKANFPEKNLNAVLRYTFINGMPGVSVVGRLNGLAEVSVKNFSVNAGKKYDTYSVDGGDPIKNPADWKLLKGVNRKDLKGIAAFKKDRRMFFYAPTNSVSNGGFFMSVITAWHKVILNAGEGRDFRFAVSLGGTKAQDEALTAFCKGESGIAKTAERKESLTALAHSPFSETDKKYSVVYLAVPPPCDGSFKGWEKVPVIAERGKSRGDIRPRYANNYLGAQDTSLVFKGGFDDKNLYVFVSVQDDIHKQEHSGGNCWSGDCIQLAFDTLMERKCTSNYIEIGMALANSGEKTYWCWHHPDRSKVGNLKNTGPWGVRRNGTRLEYEFALPLNFLKPFVKERGKLGFNLVAQDDDGKNGVDKWLPLTDGLGKGKEPKEYKDLQFHLETVPGAAAVGNTAKLFFDGDLILVDYPLEFGASTMIAAKDLPAVMEIRFSNGPVLKKNLTAGFNSFRFNVPAGKLKSGQQQITARIISEKSGVLSTVIQEKNAMDAPAMKERVSEVVRINQQLKKSVETVAKQGKDTVYLSSLTAMTDFFIQSINSEVYAKELFRRLGFAPPRKMMPVDYKQRFFLYDRALRNLDYLKKILREAQAKADAVLVGKTELFSVPSMPKKVRSVTRDGGIYLGDKEYFFIGPNTWGLHYRDLDLFAALGFNFFDIFQHQGAYVDSWEEPRILPIDDVDYRFNGRLVTRAEELGMYFYSRHYRGNMYFKPELDTLERERDHWSGVLRYQAASPSSLYVVTLYEGFHKSDDPAWLDREFQKHLQKEFGPVEKINRIFHTSYKRFEEIKAVHAVKNTALKYELFRAETALNFATVRKANKIKREIWGDRPFSTAYTLVNFQPWNPIEKGADYERLWKNFDYIGWDGGIGEFGSNYATMWSADELMFCDLARSVAPEKPVSNQEVHVIPDGFHGENDFNRVYLGIILPYFHGRNTGVLWHWTMDGANPYGEFFQERAVAFHAFSKAALDVRRLTQEIIPFRKQKSPVALYYSVPSLCDSGYIRQMTAVYEGLFFSSAYPVRFVTEEMAANGALKDYKLLIVPGSRRTPDKAAAAIAEFQKNGGNVLCFGKGSLSRNEYNNPPAADRGTLLKNCKFSSAVTAKEIFNECRKEMAKLNLLPGFEIKTSAGEVPFAVEYRSYTGKDGLRYFYVVNQNKTPVTLQMPSGKWLELFSGTKAGKTVRVPAAGIYFYREEK